MRQPLHAWLGCWLLGMAAAACATGPISPIGSTRPIIPAGPSLAACDAGFQTVLQAAADATPGEARAVWLSRRLIRWPGMQPEGRFRLLHSARGRIVAAPGQVARGADGALRLRVETAAEPATLQTRFKWLAAGALLALRAADLPRLQQLHRGQLVLVQEGADGRVRQATALQVAGALDDLYASAETVADLGATARATRATRAMHAMRTRFKLWAPTAQSVRLCLHRNGTAPAHALLPLQRDAATGVWAASAATDLSGLSGLSGYYYTYLVEVFVRGVGLVRNRVTDPYSLSLTTNSRRSWVGSLDAPTLKPPGWLDLPRPTRVQAATDLVIYELHVRDFSANDPTVPEPHRGKYLAFTDRASNGMQHLRALSAAGLTDVHLLPVFDIASIPEQGCTTAPAATLAAAAPDAETQQATVMAAANTDCYNWGYDPWHYTAPEGSYASDAADGAVRVLELRQMVHALHAVGLRVGMDVVYNHTPASGQKERSVLDRIVPGYYQRLNAAGQVETSTCCDNTATENTMMAKLMIDSAVVWARDHHIDSFRFDLMGHHPRAVMERLQAAVDKAAGRHIHLIGEGWNFGEVANGTRFVQASQGSLNGSGVGAFSDRGRDAARGGGCCDDAAQTVARQGWLNGQFYDPKPGAVASVGDLLKSADLVRVGLAGTLRDYRLHTADGSVKALRDIDYAGQAAGFASQPAEVVNYVENHDNQTLFDINVLRLPRSTSHQDRARVQVLGLALTAFSQGVAYFHAGTEALRSKNGDRNSYDSGDWFNRMDLSFSDNFWGSGLPPKQDNADFWPVLKPLLADPAIKPSAADIAFTRDAFLDLLKMRASSTLFRLRTAEDVAQRLRFHNTGPTQTPTLMVAHLDGRGLAGSGFAELIYAVNVDKAAVTLALPALQGRPLVLHPVHRSATAADKRPALEARWDSATGMLTVPARTALVYVGD